MMRVKKILCAALAAVCLLGCAPLSAHAVPLFPTVNSYQPGQFSDVGFSAWYTADVITAYELGLMQGYPNGAFCPGGNVTLAETVTLAARLHRLYLGDNGAFAVTAPWYQAYVDYALENGILSAEYPDYDAPALRREFAAILAHAFPAAALPELNLLADDAIPDVHMADEFAAEIYLLYRAGILVGNDPYGTFTPDTEIRRSEVAAIVTRMADPDCRQRVDWKVQRDYPALNEGPAVEDAFFADSAMVGNSLVQGMMLSSGLSQMDFFCYQSTTVFNPNGESPDRCFDRLLRGSYARVYIEYGINELGRSREDFIDAYRRIIQRIREKMPDAELYIMAITPVTKNRSDAGIFTMTKIRSYNEALYDLARETECWYLDSCTLLCDETGYLPAKYAGWDGSPHLSTVAYQEWAQILRTHYAQ